ncbi:MULTISPECIES: hypothetical protein [Actinosynnema]|uniref:hypothetical protein n=1 Tax=Actinosynnema TaxID=40566 RepID=UPI0020A399D1|nr:hypothetical protein [Actinosynnema pretiosum]
MRKPRKNGEAAGTPWGAVLGGTAVFLVTLALVLGIAAAILVEWPFDADGWAALGQWVGGLGAFAAVAVALGIASRDRRDGDRRERDAARSRAFLVTTSFRAEGVVVTNHGPEPVTRLVVPALHSQAGVLTADDAGIPVRQLDMLLPGQSWTAPWPKPREQDVKIAVITHVLRELDDDPAAVRAEVHWSDLGGRHWVRVGSLDPREATASDWRPTAEIDQHIKDALRAPARVQGAPDDEPEGTPTQRAERSRHQG